jgi:hypothetical protein
MSYITYMFPVLVSPAKTFQSKSPLFGFVWRSNRMDHFKNICITYILHHSIVRDQPTAVNPDSHMNKSPSHSHPSPRTRTMNILELDTKLTNRIWSIIQSSGQWLPQDPGAGTETQICIIESGCERKFSQQNHKHPFRIPHYAEELVKTNFTNSANSHSLLQATLQLR